MTFSEQILTEIGHDESIRAVDRDQGGAQEVIAGPGSEIGLLASLSACCKTARYAGTPGWKEASDASPTTLLQEDDSAVRLVLPACLEPARHLLN